jgi:hypothetical protein
MIDQSLLRESISKMTRRQENKSHGTQLHNQTVYTITISDEMRDSGNITDEIIAEAVTYLHKDGILVLENAIDPAHLDALDELLGPEAEEIARDPDHHFNFGKETRFVFDLLFERLHLD